MFPAVNGCLHKIVGEFHQFVLENEWHVKVTALLELVFAGGLIISENIWWNLIISQPSVQNYCRELKSRRKHCFIKKIARGSPRVPEK